MKTVILLGLVFAANLLFSQSQSDTIKISDDIQLIQVAEDIYVHKSFTTSTSYGRFSSNGLIVIKNGKAFMIDTPFTNDETATIYNFLKNSMNVNITFFTGGHFHEDCIGGMSFLKEKGAVTILNEQTEAKCEELDLPLPDKSYKEKYQSNFEGIPFECAYYGGGHSADNSVVYFPESKVLFGGCLIKSMGSTNMGNLGDAVSSEWASTVTKVLKAYPDAKVVVPGHGNTGSIELLNLTIDLANRAFGE